MKKYEEPKMRFHQLKTGGMLMLSRFDAKTPEPNAYGGAGDVPSGNEDSSVEDYGIVGESSLF